MKQIFLFISVIAFVNNINAINIDESNFLEFLSSKKYITAQFSQSTYKDSQERKVIGEIKANRKGMCTLIYEEPLNEIISSNGYQLFRLDKEIEQLDISPIDDTLFESPIGIFSASSEELKKIFLVTSCSQKRNHLIKCTLKSKSDNSFVRDVLIELYERKLYSLTYTDTFDQKVSLTFSNSSWKTIPDHEFILKIPEGIDVVNH